jgi:hypothetical protein
MGSMLDNIIMIVAIAVLVIVLQFIFQFLGYSFEDYGAYFYWLLAVLLFILILPTSPQIFAIE